MNNLLRNRLFLLLLILVIVGPNQITVAEVDARDIVWTPVGLSGGGGMFSPAISPADFATSDVDTP